MLAGRHYWSLILLRTLLVKQIFSSRERIRSWVPSQVCRSLDENFGLTQQIQWWVQDSNLRRQSQQIYSLPRLTASVTHRICTILLRVTILLLN